MADPQDVFRLITLRGPALDTTIDVVDRSAAEHAKLVALGGELRRAGRTRELVAAIQALTPMTVDELRTNVPWLALAEKFAVDTSADISGWHIDDGTGGNIGIGDYRKRIEFEAENAKATESWLMIQLKELAGDFALEEAVEAHANVLKFAEVIRLIAAGPLGPGVGRRVFESYPVSPIQWRRRATPVRRPNRASPTGSGGAAAAGARASIGRGAFSGFWRYPGTESPAEWRRQFAAATSEATDLERILVKAALLFDSRKVPAARFRPDFVRTLQARLSARENRILSAAIRGRSYPDFSSLQDAIAENIGAKFLTANDLCRRIRVFEEEESEHLPPARDTDSRFRPSIRALGWGDLMVVREELIGYEAGEISHIENVLEGENTTRKLDRRHETQTIMETETLNESSSENTLATTDRFELQAESENAIANDFSVAAGVNTSGKYGLTTVETSVTGEFARTSEESSRTATTIAHDVVDTAVTRTRESARELQRTMTTDSFRELTFHGIDNTLEAVVDPKPRTGIYQWVNKVQRLQLYQYGKRMMVEFAIPEPGLTLIEAGQPVRPDAPKPRPLAVGPAEISEGNYLCLADLYHARDIAPPPPLLIQIGEAFATDPNYDESHKSAGATAEKELPVPQGYEPIGGRFAATGRGMTQTLGEDWFHAHIAVGGEAVLDSLQMNLGPGGDSAYEGSFVLESPTVTDDHGLPVTVRWTGPDDRVATMNIHVRCRRSIASLNSWRLDVYEQLLAAHGELEAAYRESLRQARFGAATEQTFGNRPSEQNRAIERNELKKWAIKLMRARPYSFDAVIAQDGAQEIDPVAADEQAPIVRFFEQCFEWDQMSYMLEPYFWGRRASWLLRQTISVPNDPRHEAFLKAGSARVIVPVAPGQEARLLTYLDSDPDLTDWDPGWTPSTWDPEHSTQRIPPTAIDLQSIAPGDVLNTTFPDLWLELLAEHRPDTLRGSGKVSVTKGSKQATLIDSNETVSETRDIGREIFIDGDRYLIASVSSDAKFTLDRNYIEATGTKSYAIGSVKRGEPWEVRVPTSLLILAANSADLDSIP